MSHPTPPESDPLVAHGSFLRRLARRLVHDDQRAEDIVQDAYLAVLERPPPARVGVRAWMSGIVKNLARHAHRTDRRRLRREAQAPPRRALGGPDEVSMRLELQRRLAEAVSRLPEPGRTTLVRRYYDGLSPARIAADERVPVRTIESRLRRARERLRSVLDRAAGGDRGQWMLAFAPMAFSPDVLSALLAGARATHAAASAATTAGTTATASSTATSATATAGGALPLLSQGAVVLGVLTTASALAGFLVGRFTPVPPPYDPRSVVRGAAPSASEGPAGAMDLHALEARWNALSQARRRLQTEHDALAARAAGGVPAARDASSASAPDPLAYRAATADAEFTSPEFDALLAEVDWAEAGRALRNLNLALRQLAQAIGQAQQDPAEGTPRRLAATADVQRWNAPLLGVEFRLRAAFSKDAARLPNVAFSHPLVQANLLRAALLFAGDPLDETQVGALETIVRRHVEAERLRRSGRSERPIGVRFALELVAARAAFFREARDVLQPAQRGVIEPREVRGRVGLDAFSEGVLWGGRVETIPFHGVAELEAAVVRLLVHRLSTLAPESRAVVVDEVRRWIAAYPSAELMLESDAFDRLGLYRLTHVRTAAEAGARLYERLLERLPPSTAGLALLQETTRVLLPVHRHP